MRSDTTPAIAELEAGDVAYEVVVTQRARSVTESAKLQGIEPDRLLKTLLVRRSEQDYVYVLIPGPRQMSWPKLRAELGVSRLSMPSADNAKEVTGYERGAITPLGGPRFETIIDAGAPTGTVAIGGGGHGVNVHIDRDDLAAHLGAQICDVAE